MVPWEALLLPAAVLLVIPVAIIPAYRRATGSIIVSAALATAIFAAFWLALGGINGLSSDAGSSFFVRLAVFATGVILTLTVWALAINAAAQTRRWVWVALLVVAGYLTFLAVFISMYAAQPCPAFDMYACPPENPIRQALIIAGYLACPVAALIYGARPSLRRVRKPPDGLVISSLRAASPANSGKAAGGE